MLILNRKIGESFTIDGQIKIIILSDFGNIRVGIEAPKHIRIVRDELIEWRKYRGKQKNEPVFAADGIEYENT